MGAKSPRRARSSFGWESSLSNRVRLPQLRLFNPVIPVHGIGLQKPKLPCKREGMHLLTHEKPIIVECLLYYLKNSRQRGPLDLFIEGGAIEQARLGRNRQSRHLASTRHRGIAVRHA